MLSFLSELFEWRDKDGNREVRSALTDGAVIDSFFQSLAAGRQAALAHRMLPALGPVLRINLILSTNFDHFIEQTFATVETPLTTFEVPVTATLPSPELVLAQRSLVKMHGGRFDVRANASVNNSPIESDVANFLGYLAGRKLQPGEQFEKGGLSVEPIAILVSGIGGLETRTITLLHHAWDRFPNLHIFWLSTGTVSHKEADLKYRFKPRGARNRFHFLQHPDHGLLLGELFQACTGTLPTAGMIFPGMWELPVPPIICKHAAFDRQWKEAKDAIQGGIEAEWVEIQRQPLVITMSTGSRGGVTVCSDLFYDRQWLRNLWKLEHAKRCNEMEDAEASDKAKVAEKEAIVAHAARPVWIDLDDVWKPVGVPLRLTLLAAKLNGDLDPISALNVDAFAVSAEKQDEFDEAVRKAFRMNYARPSQKGERLLVFLNAQEGCGIDSPMNDKGTGLRERLAHPKNLPPLENPWEEQNTVKRLISLVLKLNEDPTCGVQFVFIVRALPAQDVARDRLEALIETSTAELRVELSRPNIHPISIGEDCSPFAPRAVVSAIGEDERFVRDQKITPDGLLLYLLTLFRHPRYPASLEHILAEFMAHRPSNCQFDFKATDRVVLKTILARYTPGDVHDHEHLPIYRRKPGGFIWMHAGVKVFLRDHIEGVWQKSNLSGWAETAFHLETLIARFYGRLLLASSDPLAGVESVHHAVHVVQRLIGPSDPFPRVVDSEVYLYLAPAALQHACLVLKLARPLFDNHLSDRFASHALLNLQTRVEALFEPSKAWPPIHHGLANLLRLLIETRGDLYLREGEYAQILKPGTFDLPDLYTIDPSFRERTRLRKAGAHICTRQFGEAEAELCNCWEHLFKEWQPFVRLALPGPNWFACLHDIPECVRQAMGWNDPDPVRFARHWVEHSRSRATPGNDSPALARYAAKLVRWTVQFLMHCSQIKYQAHARRTPDLRDARLDTRKKEAGIALWFDQLGLEILRNAVNLDCDLGDDFVWAENARLRAHSAMYQLHAIPYEEEELASDRAVIGAQSFLDDFPLKHAGILRIIVNLRRAEVQLIKVPRVSNRSGNKKIYFREYQLRLDPVRKLRTNANAADASVASAVKAAVESFPKDNLTKIHTLVSDALSFLDAAEEELRRQPKARWWWWIFAVLKMKAVEYLYTCRLARDTLLKGERPADQGWADSKRSPSALPVDLLPPRVVNYLWGGVLDVIILKRMNDLFFLPRIVESFQRTEFAHWAYQSLQHLDPEQLQSGSEQLGGYLIEMQKILAGALAEFDPGKFQPQQKNAIAVSADLRDYARRCSISAAAIRDPHCEQSEFDR
jgi:hypothetical protein